MEERQRILLPDRLVQVSTAKTFHAGHARFNFRHQCLFPSLVEHLQVVIAQLIVQKVVHVDGASLYVVDLEGVDHERDLSPSQHREPFRFAHFFGHLTSSLEL